MTPLALLDLAERIDAAAEYLSVEDQRGASVLRSAANALRRQLARELNWTED
jgi:hypothetical protein